MENNHSVKIKEWPKQKAILEHHFQLEKPCPVAIVFDKHPALVNILTSEDKPVYHNIHLEPVCIKVCDPICVDSSYSVGIDFMGQKLFNIEVKGRTIIAPCKENSIRIISEKQPLN